MVVPRPGSLSSSTAPLSSSIFERTMSMPIPRPDTSLTFSAVLRPGGQTSCASCCGVMACGVGRREQPHFDGLRARRRSASRPRPSSEMRMTTLPPRWKASSEIVPCGGFPAATRASGDSMPWSAALRTAWISGSPNSSIIRLSSSVFSPLDDQADVLAVGARDVADDAMEAGEQRPDRHHPHVQRALLNAVADAVERGGWPRTGRRRGRFGRPVAGHRLLQLPADLRQARLADGQLAGQIHQLVETLDVHAQRFGGLGGGIGSLAAALGRLGGAGSCRRN